MIPLRDTVASKNYPIVNISLIVINVAAFLLQLSFENDLDRFVYYYGLVPARYFVPKISTYFSFEQQTFSFLSYMFLHGGFLHLLGNMWSLYIFGDNVEDRLGSLRYLAFYLLCGITSGFSHLILNIDSNIPTIGASGAIAGVMGAYFILYPNSKILTLIPILFIPWFIEIPAFFFLGFWFVMQFINATGSQGSAAGIAWWAHIGGFLFGILFLKILQMLPNIGISERVEKVTVRKRTQRLQVIRPGGSDTGPNLYGVIRIKRFEALIGCGKVVNISMGFNKRLIKIKIPPGVNQGQKLRLHSQGKKMPDGTKGDLLLKVVIE